MRQIQDYSQVISPTSTIPVIECEQVSTVYTNTLKRSILNNINCTINQGEFVVLLGLNGAGKSTLLRAIAGLSPIENGVIKIQGKKQIKQPNRSIGMLFQGGGLIKQLSAIDNVLCGRLGALSAIQTFWGFPQQERRLALQLLEKFGLLEQAYQKTGQLSGGQQQKVAIARALIQCPQILLADEPITGLDVMAARQVMQTLSDLHQQQNITIVVVLHDLELAANYAQRAIILDQGKIIYDGNSQELAAKFSQLLDVTN